MDENDNGLKRTAIKPASTCQHTVAIWNWLLMVYFHKIYFITNVIFYRKKLYFSKLIYLMLQKIKVETIIFEIHLIFWSCCWSLQKAKKKITGSSSLYSWRQAYWAGACPSNGFPTFDIFQSLFISVNSEIPPLISSVF